MKYMGGKFRLAKHLLPIILKDRVEDQFYVEPFVGGGNSIALVDGNRIGADANPFTIHALNMIKNRVDEIPSNNKEFTKADHMEAIGRIRSGSSTDVEMDSFASFVYSFGGIFCSGWSSDRCGCDYVSRGKRAAIAQSPKLQGVELICCDYKNLAIPDNSIIYCDPPYRAPQNTK